MKRTLLLIGVLLIGISSLSLRAQDPIPESHLPAGFGITIPLSEMEPMLDLREDTVVRNPKLRIRNYPFASTALPKGADEAWQSEMGTWGEGDERGAPTINFEGLQQSGGIRPPDTQGDVGPNHYFQVVNTSYQIWDKNGTSLVGPTSLRTIWSGAFPEIASVAISDPIVLYDQHANRWFVSIFKSGSPYAIYIAVSTGANPTGSYYVYKYNWATQPDYAKYGIGEIGYYYASNTNGQDVGVFERARMLVGNSNPRLITFDNPNRPNSGFHSIMPLDNDGPWGPTDTRGLFLTINDDAWGGGSDQLWIYQLVPNYETPASSTFSRIQQLNVTSFSANFGPTWNNIDQPGTSQRLDAVPEVLMFRAQYRNFGTHQSIVACHSVNVDGAGRAGVRWYELRKTGANWFIRQQSTYAPGTSESRWMGSIAMNKYGDIALGYSVSSTSTFPSIRYTGRKAGDALHTMTMTERTIWAGTHSQTNSNRWGDYSCMSVDPSDDVRFWYTNEYMIAGNAWRTRVAAFSFSSYCYASGGCLEHISRVQAGGIDNTTVCTNYGDYTLSHSTNVPLNSTLKVTVTNGAPNSLAQCGIWIDWNRDGDFDDANEAITLVNSTGLGPFVAFITPPAGATTGNVMMRIRITWNTTPTPCGNHSYGEVEDYTLNLTPNATSNSWIGVVSNDWFEPQNWSLGQIPNSSVSATIPSGTPHSPVMGGGNTASCNSLTINAGAVLSMNSPSYFDIYGNLNSNSGQFIMNGASSFLYFRGSGNNTWNDSNQNDTYSNVRVWKSVPTAVTTMSHNMTTSGTFQIWSGTFQLSNLRTLQINSVESTALEIQNSGTLVLETGRAINVAGSVVFRNGSQSNVSGGILRCGVNFTADNNTSYNISLSGSTLIMNGAGSQLIRDLDGGNLVLGNLEVDKPSGTVTINDAYLNIEGYATVQNGTLNLGAFGCNVSGQINIFGTLVMNTGSVGLSAGEVRFRSGSNATITHGDIYTFFWQFEPGCNVQIGTGNTVYTRNMLLPIEPTAHFGNLVIMPWTVALGELEGRTSSPVNVAGNLTVQNGASWSFPSGTGLFVTGNSNIQSGGSLTFQAGSEFHTQGSLNISGNLVVQTGGNVLVNNGFTVPSSGVISVLGGSFVSDNPYNGSWVFLNGTLNMTGGLFEITNNAPQFTSTAINNISGGTIRSGVTLNALSTNNFQPTGGLVEITSIVNNGNLSLNSANWFHDFQVNSPAGNNVRFLTDVTVKNNLTILAGALRCGTSPSSTYVLTVGGNFTNTSIHAGFIPESGTVVFNGVGAANHQHLIGTINFHNVTNAKTGGGELRFQGIANIADSFLANGTNIVSGPTLTVGGLFNLSTGTFLQYGPSNPNVSVNNFTMGGSLNVASGTFACTDLTNAGVFGIVNLSGGSITLNQDPGQFPDIRATLDISGGTMTINGGSGTSWWGWGLTPTHLQMTGGVLDFNNAGITVLDGYPVTTAISGGTIKTSGSFTCTHPNFTPTGGMAELYGSATAAVSTTNGSNFYNFRVDKSGGALLGFEPGDDLFSLGKIDERLAGKDSREYREPGKYLPDGGRSGGLVVTNEILKVTNNTVVNAGTLQILHSATNAGNVTVNSGGKIEIWNVGSLAMGASRSLTVNNGGALELNGTIDSQPKLSRISSGNYALNIESGGTIGAVYALFEYMNTSGVNIKAGATVDPAKAFTYTTFRNGQSGGRLLTLNNNQTLAINYANFPNNTWGGTYNVFKTENAGVVVFGGYNGLFAGESNEWDPHNRLHWGGVIAPFVNLNGVNIVNGQEICFEATNTLTVGGGGSTFHVQNGGSANLVAGQKISMLAGTRVFSGGYMLARITTTSDYCSLPPALMAFAEESIVKVDEDVSKEMEAEKFFRVFPNPTTGTFTLELLDNLPTVSVEIFGVHGDKIISKVLSGLNTYEFDLSTQPRGVYIVRIISGDEAGIERVIRQ